MVSLIIVSEYDRCEGAPSGRQKIPNGPLYALQRVKEVCSNETRIQLWTRRSVRDAQTLELDTRDVAALVQELDDRDYVDSEWCQSGKAWAACDAYRLARRERRADLNKSLFVEYFLKFAVAKTGQLVLVASCHLSR